MLVSGSRGCLVNLHASVLWNGDLRSIFVPTGLLVGLLNDDLAFLTTHLMQCVRQLLNVTQTKIAPR